MSPSEESPERNDDLRIAEYVLGVLSAGERAAIEASIASDAEFAERCAAWQARLAPLVAEIEPSPAADYLWSGIEARLGFLGEPEPRPLLPATRRPTLWESLALWRWLSLGGLAASLLLASMLLLSPPAPPSFTATLQLDNGQAAFVVTVEPAQQRLIIIPTAPIDFAGKAAELWLIPPGQPPVSLGVLAGEGRLSLALPGAIQGSAMPRSVLAVSLEPPGGSPTGQPTGPVVAKGEIFGL